MLNQNNNIFLQDSHFKPYASKIEDYHRGIKQFCEKCQARTEKAQRNHILFSLRAFLRIKRFCFRTGLTWFEAKIGIVREVVKTYLRCLKYVLSA